jgi:hypothetical protein
MKLLEGCLAFVGDRVNGNSPLCTELRREGEGGGGGRPGYFRDNRVERGTPPRLTLAHSALFVPFAAISESNLFTLGTFITHMCAPISTLHFTSSLSEPLRASPPNSTRFRQAEREAIRGERKHGAPISKLTSFNSASVVSSMLLHTHFLRLYG